MPASVFLKTPKLKKPVGRPCLLTKTCEAKLLSAIEEGMPLKQAAMLAGICYETLNRWRIRGEDENAPIEFRQFCQSLRRSQAMAMQACVSCIRKAANHEWRAAAWLLERRHPEEFSLPEKIEHSGRNGKPLFNFPPVETIEPEALIRMKKQAGVAELVKKLGSILMANRAEKEAKEMDAASESKMARRLRED
jgi:hypothetical protein